MIDFDLIHKIESVIDDVNQCDISDIVLDSLEDLQGFGEFESSVYCLFLPETELGDEVIYDIHKTHPFSISMNFYTRKDLSSINSHNLWNKIGQNPSNSLIYYGIYYHIDHSTSIDLVLLKEKFDNIRQRVSQLTERKCSYGYTHVPHEQFKTILMLYFKIQ